MSVGFDEKGADNRIAQYETDYRVPRKEMLDKIALALTVNRLNFYSAGKGDSAQEDLLRTLFWLEESGMGRYHPVSACPQSARTHLARRAIGSCGYRGAV